MGNPNTPGCTGCNIDTSSTTSTLTVGGLHSYHAGTYTCTVSETGRPDSGNSDDYTVSVAGEMMMCVLSSPNAVCHISGAGIYASNAAPQFDDRPIANNGLILSASNGMSVNFISNTSQSGVGVITVPDGRTQSSGGDIGVWRVTSPFNRPGVLHLTTISSSSSLQPSSQGIYTGTIPDSNSNMFVFNVGLYPTGFNGKLLLLKIFS